MKNSDLGLRSKWVGIGAAAALIVGSSAPSQAAFDFLKRDNRKLSPSEQASNEGAAGSMLAEAQSNEASNDFRKALKTYESIVKNYPRSDAAAEAQFKVGEILQVDGKDKKAFEAFEKFLTDYKGSPRFAEAVQRQFSIAENLRVNGTKGFLGGIGAEIQPSKLMEFYEQISANAPRTELAAKSRIAVGTIQAGQGEIAEAIISFESVVQDYPGTNYAAEAQYNLVKLHGQEASKSFSPVDLRQQREAGDDFINQFGDDPRTQEVRQVLGALGDKEAKKAFEVGRFYEKSGDLKAAAIYYREVARHPGTKYHEDAQKRLGKLIQQDPSIASVANAQPVSRTEAPSRSPESPGIQPPAPELPQAAPPAVASPAPLIGKPKMRTSEDDVLPIPTDDPVLGN
ncbi:MAG: tetratricopeptide repeat protein [Verrucomicrobiae bacterium]|nr:tetratricopeptide repeat protein [Verrucomicrobiae bacterium]